MVTISVFKNIQQSKKHIILFLSPETHNKLLAKWFGNDGFRWGVILSKSANWEKQAWSYCNMLFHLTAEKKFIQCAKPHGWDPFSQQGAVLGQLLQNNLPPFELKERVVGLFGHTTCHLLMAVTPQERQKADGSLVSHTTRAWATPNAAKPVLDCHAICLRQSVLVRLPLSIVTAKDTPAFFTFLLVVWCTCERKSVAKMSKKQAL